MIAGTGVIAASIVLAALARSLVKDFYRPWLDRRHAADLADVIELRAWVKAMKS